MCMDKALSPKVSADSDDWPTVYQLTLNRKFHALGLAFFTLGKHLIRKVKKNNTLVTVAKRHAGRVTIINEDEGGYRHEERCMTFE